MLAIILSPCGIALIVSKSGFIICRYVGHRLTTRAEYHSLREFCRSPRVIASVGKGGNASDIELVKNLVTSYISKPSCLILSTVACESE